MTGGWRFRIYVQPRASRSRIGGRHGDILKVQVRAAPVGGAANAAVIELLAQAFDVPRRAVRIVHGQGGREKLVEVDTADADACQRCLEGLLDGDVDKRAACD